MYAILNIKTEKFVYGTKFGSPVHQRTSDKKMMTFESEEEARYAFKLRKCGVQYRIVKLAPIAVEKVFEFDKRNGYRQKGMYADFDSERADNHTVKRKRNIQNN